VLEELWLYNSIQYILNSNARKSQVRFLQVSRWNRQFEFSLFRDKTKIFSLAIVELMKHFYSCLMELLRWNSATNRYLWKLVGVKCIRRFTVHAAINSLKWNDAGKASREQFDIRHWLFSVPSQLTSNSRPTGMLKTTRASYFCKIWKDWLDFDSYLLSIAATHRYYSSSRLSLSMIFLAAFSNWIILS
jgi:hypothetical protein